ncbi:MAG: hypothetical protein U0527_06640 [Candidatus Eisenbacteria bacterium]
MRELGVSVKVEFRKVRAGAATRRERLAGRRPVDHVEVISAALHLCQRLP